MRARELAINRRFIRASVGLLAALAMGLAAGACGSSSPSSGSTTSTTSSSGAKAWTGSVLSVHFLDASTGWVLTYSPNRLLFTTDAGKSWSEATPPGAGKPSASMLGPGSLITGTFLSASQWWIAVSPESPVGSSHLSSVVYETTDSGRSWKRDGPSFSGGAVSVFFLDATDGWLEMSPGAAMGWNPVTIYGTTDGGSTWTKLSGGPALAGESGSPGALSGDCDKMGLSFSTPAVGWSAAACAGGDREVARSTDGGRVWTTVDLHLSSKLAAYGAMAWPPVFSRTDGAFGLSGGPVGEWVFITTNGGASWTAHLAPIRSARAGSPDVVSPSECVIPAGSSLYVSVDGGQSWTRVTSGVDLANYSVDFTSATTGWAWNLSPLVLHTTDGGRSWQKVVLAR